MRDVKGSLMENPKVCVIGKIELICGACTNSGKVFIQEDYKLAISFLA